MSSEYTGLFSEFYDVLHNHALEAPGYAALARETGGRVLELGCGTGRLLLPLAREGLEVTGLDDAPDMLERCRAKLAGEDDEVRERVHLVKAGLTDFELEGDFGLIFIACNTANHLLTPEAAVACFRRAGSHLAPGGMLVVDNSVPDFAAMAEADGEEEVADYVNPVTDLQLVCRFTARFDFPNQIEMNVIDLEERDGTEVVRHVRAETTMTWFTARELELLLAAAGLEVEGVHGSLARDPLTAKSREMIAIARR
ncbi:MAG: class I SAM-dependent methyltransferase [Planctomycetota bacterium]